MSINSVTISGRLVRDPELRYSQSGTAIFSNAIAVEEYDKNAPRDEQPVSFVDVVLFGNFAELVAGKARKGDLVAGSGRLHQNKWTAEDGTNRSKIEVILRDLDGEFKFRKAGENGTAPAAETTEAPAAEAPADDDIPF